MPPSDKLKPSDHAEQSIIHAILDGELMPGASLPPERVLAVALGVTRPTLREALMRMNRDGWINIQHGRPTRVNDVFTEGGLNVLSAIVSADRPMPDTFVAGLLEVRCVLAPVYFAAALRCNSVEVILQLEAGPQDDWDAAQFCDYDWMLHHQMCVLSKNPIYSLILNGFRDLYKALGRDYFSNPEHRMASREFYRQLHQAALAGDVDAVTNITTRAMNHSLDLWQTMRRSS